MTETHKLTFKGLERDVSLAPFTTFKVGGPAKYFFAAKTRDDIVHAVSEATKAGVPFFILGGGSNVLVSDKGFDGLVIRLQNTAVEIEGTHVTADAGGSLQLCIQKTIKAGLMGLEYLTGIPGSVGGAVAGNAGTSQRWIAERITQVHIVNGAGVVTVVPKNQCDFSYRYSRFKYSTTEIVLAAEFELEKGDRKTSAAEAKKIIDRRAHQPAGKACAGCAFKNPPEGSAGKIIDEAGLKGKRIGGAFISQEHGNFIVNDGTATSEDIVILISYVKQQIRDKYGIQLHEEIKYVGF
ncbi:MAG: UDP-N-acetylmuramate dehydrogenase [Patescibacteria group bacterium]|jgi:UDP-N-acetylmuramate dehydrogenase